MVPRISDHSRLISFDEGDLLEAHRLRHVHDVRRCGRYVRLPHHSVRAYFRLLFLEVHGSIFGPEAIPCGHGERSSQWYPTGEPRCHSAPLLLTILHALLQLPLKRNAPLGAAGRHEQVGTGSRRRKNGQVGSSYPNLLEAPFVKR